MVADSLNLMVIMLHTWNLMMVARTVFIIIKTQLKQWLCHLDGGYDLTLFVYSDKVSTWRTLHGFKGVCILVLGTL